MNKQFKDYKEFKKAVRMVSMVEFKGIDYEFIISKIDFKNNVVSGSVMFMGKELYKSSGVDGVKVEQLKGINLTIAE